MSFKKGILTIEKDGFTLIKASRRIETPNKIVCKNNQIKIYVGNKLKETIRLKPPYFFKFQIQQVAAGLIISVYNFEEFITTIQWLSIAELPMITDTFSAHFNLEYFDSYTLNKQTERLIYISTKGGKSRQILKVNKQACEFHIQFYDLNQSHFLIDQLHKHIVITSSKNNPITIPLKDLEKIIFYLDKIPKEAAFNLFVIEAVKTTNEVISLLEFRSLSNPKTDKKHINNISSNQFFNTIILLIQELRQLPEVNFDISMEFDLP